MFVIIDMVVGRWLLSVIENDVRKVLNVVDVIINILVYVVFVCCLMMNFNKMNMIVMGIMFVMINIKWLS